MARSVDVYCMFCMSTPCTCNKKPPKKSTPKARIETPPPALPSVAPPPAKKADMPPPVTGQAKLPIRKVESKLTNTVVRPREDIDLENAVTVFAVAGLLSEETINEQRGKIKLPKSMIEALKWKARNGKY